MLHIVSRAPPHVSGPPVVFVHGACSTVWCWEEHYLDWFAARGLPAYALDLRGHGASDGQERLQSFGIRDYVDDVRQVVAGLPAAPVLVGHSMGGLVVQKYLERGTARAAVLLASCPTGGMARDILRLAARHPATFARALAARRLSRIYTDEALVRTLLFTPTTPAPLIRRCMAQLCEESWRACRDMNIVLPYPAKVVAPVLVIGGALDQMISAGSVRRTAAAYGAPCVVFPHMAHMLNVEPGWEEVATTILDWVREIERRSPS